MAVELARDGARSDPSDKKISRSKFLEPRARRATLSPLVRSERGELRSAVWKESARDWSRNSTSERYSSGLLLQKARSSVAGGTDRRHSRQNQQHGYSWQNKSRQIQSILPMAMRTKINRRTPLCIIFHTQVKIAPLNASPFLEPFVCCRKWARKCHSFSFARV